MSQCTCGACKERLERRHRNGHTIELQGVMWRCLHCDHRFDALSEADAFWCGDPCACPSRVQS